MEIIEYSKDHVLIVAVKGRLDAVSSPDLDASLAKLLGRGERFLLMDLHGLEYVSSAGIRVFYRTLGEIEAKSGKIAIAGAADTVKKVFDMVDLASDIALYADLEAALKGF